MLSMLEWLCVQLMGRRFPDLSERKRMRTVRLAASTVADTVPGDTRVGTMYLMVPKLRNRGYIPFFVTERKRSEAALIQVIQEAFV